MTPVMTQKVTQSNTSSQSDATRWWVETQNNDTNVKKAIDIDEKSDDTKQ